MQHDDIVAVATRDELREKLAGLESRALALESVLTRLPADQLVIRQLQAAGVNTLRETLTTVASRAASIKMTLLTIGQAMVAKGVQRLADEGATLDSNLLRVRSALTRDVVSTAANAAGTNRLNQARQLQEIVTETQDLVRIVETSHIANAEKFAEARKLFEEARQEMLGLAKRIPDRVGG